MSCTALRGFTAITLLLAVAACGPPTRSRSADDSQTNSRQAPPNEPAAAALVWRSFVARDTDPDGAPREAHVFEPGPVSYYIMASGATNDTIQAGLVANGAIIQECDADVLNGDDGYFCSFDFVAPGQYEIWVLLNDEPLEARAFEIMGAREPSAELSADDPASARRLTSIPWREQPSARDLRRAYPRRALERGVAGQVLLRCTILPRGEVDCAVAEEAPSDMEFGAAALRLSSRFRMLTHLEDGQSTAGAVIEVPIEFKAQ